MSNKTGLPPKEFIVFDGKWLVIALVGHKPKTDVYAVYNKATEEFLGNIMWYFPWRQYAFYPYYQVQFVKQCSLCGATGIPEQIIWAQSCCDDLSKFLQILKDKRKKTLLRTK